MPLSIPINTHATLQAPLPPDALIIEVPPTAQQLYDSISPEVIYNLWRLVTEGVRYEENTYGYFNSAFVSIFVPQRRFQVNPQYPSRPTVVVGQGAHGRNISVSSTGGIHAGEGTGREIGMKYPDFTFTKPIPRIPPSPRVHCNIGIAEIKTLKPGDKDVENGNATVWEAILQTQGYSERLLYSPFAIHDQNSQCVATFLVFGKYYTCLYLVDTPAGPLWEIDSWQHIFEDMSLPERAPFLYRLCEVAVLHWNYDG